MFNRLAEDPVDVTAWSDILMDSYSESPIIK